jgi:hypothetical protein
LWFVRLDASHHFDCPRIRDMCPIPLDDWQTFALRGEWREFFRFIFPRVSHLVESCSLCPLWSFSND